MSPVESQPCCPCNVNRPRTEDKVMQDMDVPFKEERGHVGWHGNRPLIDLRGGCGFCYSGVLIGKRRQKIYFPRQATHTFELKAFGPLFTCLNIIS